MTQAQRDAISMIAGYGKCMTAKLKASGRGEQNAEMMLVSRTDGVLTIEDYGGWANRHAALSRMLRELDAAGALPDFAPVLLQTGDRCVVRRAADGGAELHLWQRQPVPDELRARIALARVLSMCGSPKYADVAVPDWCFEEWVEAGVPPGEFDAACAALAAAAAAPPTDGRACWRGTAHHHPSRMRLVELAAEMPELLACNAVVDSAGSAAAGHAPLQAQVAAYSAMLDLQGKGYSSRLKLLLHAGRPVLLVARPWREHFMDGLREWVHYIPVRENLADLPERLRWLDEHRDEAAAIGRAGQAFARERLTRSAALEGLADAIRRLP